MANEPLAKQSERQGTYELSEAINGKPSWKSGTKAIWYSQYKQWIFGKTSNIGTNYGVIFSFANTDCPQQVKASGNIWKYWDGSEWQEANLNDINFQCASKSE